ncbi:hypothetical protein ISU82_14960 [Leptospira borgpetersenii serovar Balcanica]|nr:hypothetical protein [Leptospira borgpetersenii]MBF3351363.1 hypothetical protein [Leptospira borgpetersenii serovar Balcanica]
MQSFLMGRSAGRPVARCFRFLRQPSWLRQIKSIVLGTVLCSRIIQI